MKRMMKFAAILAVAIALFACKTDEDPKEETGGVDFTSQNTDYSVLVRNNTSYRLVAFKGDLHADKAEAHASAGF